MPAVPAQAACAGSGGAVGAAVAAALQFFAASQCLIDKPWPSRENVADGARFDFIIVGGGTAGATLAARLAEVPAFSVLLLEAGPDPPQESIIPGFQSALLNSPYDWNFTSVADGVSGHALAGGRQRQPRGKMLGGSGSLNSMVYARGFPRDYEEWAAALGPEWGWDRVLPFFTKTERMTDQKIVGDPELMRYHGRDGEIEVSGFNDTFFHIERFLEAFEEIGFPLVDDMTYPHRVGAGRFSHTVSDGRRASSATALLGKAGSNLVVMRNALVSRIITENATAVGVEVITERGELRLYADKEVVVTAGTFNTAKLLLLSGIGPRDHLAELGVPPVRDLPVGDNLHDHVMFLTYISAEKGTCARAEGAAHMDVVRYLYERGGPLGRADSAGALLVLEGSPPNTPDFAFYPTCVPVRGGFYEGCVSVIGLGRGICEQLDLINRDRELISVAVVLLKPRSRGVVRLRSRDPRDDPLIYSGTFSDPADLLHYPVAVDVVRALADTCYFRERDARLLDFRLEVCAGLVGAEETRCEARAMGTSAWHAGGTAALGGVLDATLRVRGVRRLRVADAAALPTPVRGNTNAPVVMLAERAAYFIKTTYGAE